jgi:8-oxo-dGTP pyrophosphatase MutT (NUDIX family)
MPLTNKGHEILANMNESYGPKEGERVFYASKNAGRITGVDEAIEALSKYADEDFKESEHPRDEDGKFAEGVGAGKHASQAEQSHPSVQLEKGEGNKTASTAETPKYPEPTQEAVRSARYAIQRIANNAIHVEASEPSNKQISYLSYLVARAGDEDSFRNTNEVLTARKASIYIDGYVQQLTKSGVDLKARERPVTSQSQTASSGTSNRTYLNVSYAQKDIAKAAGAKWDADKKKWYYPNGEIPEALREFTMQGGRKVEQKQKEHQVSNDDALEPGWDDPANYEDGNSVCDSVSDNTKTEYVLAVGVMFITPDKRALFVKRGPDRDHAGEWCFPGGGVEDGETSVEAVIREAKEEVGYRADGLRELARHRDDINDVVVPPPTQECLTEYVPKPDVSHRLVDYTTFACLVDEEFQPKLNDECVGYAWSPIDDPPQPLHPGVMWALAKANAKTELDVAKAMSRGELTSPQKYANITFFDIRITGTGVAYRDKYEEFCIRDPAIYLNEEFLERCNGLPVIWEHPVKSTLNSDEFQNRIVGVVFVPYIKGDEVWSIAKIYDDDAIKLLSSKQFSTSPSVAWVDPDANRHAEFDGKAILIEDKPGLIDHIAICEIGVWDKGGPADGVESVDVGRADALDKAANVLSDFALDAAIRDLNKYNSACSK